VDWHERLAEQNYAHLHVDTGALTKARLSVAIDGTPVPEGAIHVGKDITATKLDDVTITEQELEANPDSFSPVVLPRVLGVYVWYVADVAKIPDSKLDPGMANALHALGYMQ
jgi:hypothetical protein